MTADARVFRTNAWVQAWLDVWGKDPRITLIDVGGAAKPQEFLYTAPVTLKRIIPATALCLAGVGYGSLSTPRAEYNDIESLINCVGDISALSKMLSSLRWNHWCVPDVLSNTLQSSHVEAIGQSMNAYVHIPKNEIAYAVGAIEFTDYLAQLGANTRLAYFHRRERLQKIGEIHIETYSIDKAFEFFALLNQFHVSRWGGACYSHQSQQFLKNFMERLVDESGAALLEVMRVNGEVVSVLFDVVYQGRRYNFQSGYAENKFPKIALGALHMGFAIQSALESKQIYDFMAGEGKNTNYKNRIATLREEIQQINIERGAIAWLRHLQHKFS